LKLTGYRGIPDRLLLQGSVATFVEFKKPGGTVARAQLNWRSRLRRKGFRAEILDSKQEFLGLLTSTSFERLSSSSARKLRAYSSILDLEKPRPSSRPSRR